MRALETRYSTGLGHLSSLEEAERLQYLGSQLL